MGRVRSVSSVALQASARDSWGDNIPPGTLYNTSTVKDEVHDVSALRRGVPTGGSFVLDSTQYDVAPVSYNGWWDQSSRTTYWSTGGVTSGVLYENFNELSSIVPYTVLDLYGLGTTAIARCSPTNPSFSLAQFIGELHGDGLPRVSGLQTLRERAHYLRNAGDEYLNVQFGWMPLVSDLRSFAKSVKNSHTTIRQYLKDSDTRIRRRYSFPPQEASKTCTGGGLFWPSTAYNGGQYGRDGSHLRQVKRSAWFSGAFKYHIPMGNDLPSKLSRWAAEADKLLGVKPTPQVLWELAPWSWAVDWFSNIGDVMTNISNLGKDGLVLEYGYIMSSWEQFDVATSIAQNGARSTMATRQRKLQRYPATPYGFAFDMTKLSASQDAVLVALGLSKGLR